MTILFARTLIQILELGWVENHFVGKICEANINLWCLIKPRSDINWSLGMLDQQRIKPSIIIVTNKVDVYSSSQIKDLLILDCVHKKCLTC